MTETVYHLAPATRWERACDGGGAYFPPTYEADGFVHATAVPELLLEVANHFYRAMPDAFVCLEMTVSALEANGTPVVFEAPAPVGDRAPNFQTGEVTQFPHLYGGVPPAVVHAVHPVTRDADGTFRAIPGVV